MAARVVAEFCKAARPAANDTDAGFAAVDLSDRVLAKTLLHLSSQHLGLGCAMAVNNASSAEVLAV